MLPKKFSQSIFLMIMSFGMSIIMSCVVTLVNTGFNDGNTEAVMAVFKYQDEKMISLETGATKIPK